MAYIAGMNEDYEIVLNKLRELAGDGERDPGLDFVTGFILNGVRRNFDLQGMSVFVTRRPDLKEPIDELIRLHRRARMSAAMTG